MARLDIRPTVGALLVGAVLVHLAVISTQVTARSGLPIVEAVAVGVFAEAQRITAGILDGTRQVWRSYVALHDVRIENDELRRALAESQVREQAEHALAGRTRSLEVVLGLQNSLTLKTDAARIIGASPVSEFRTVTIDKGGLSGLQSDMAVVAPDGVVGRVVVVGPAAARVHLLIDQNAAAGAMVERSRAQGVAIGTGDGRLRMTYVSEVSDVVDGDRVVTSGIDGIYPQGFVIGRVSRVVKSGGAYRDIVVEPAVNFGALEDVLVVTAPRPTTGEVPETP